jgi:hypothetical protein
MNAFHAAITFLRTTDLATTSAFYERVLQCPLVLDQGACRIYATSANGSYLGFCTSATPVPQPEAVCLTFVVPTADDVDAWFQVLRRNHVPIGHAPRTTRRTTSTTSSPWTRTGTRWKSRRSSTRSPLIRPAHDPDTRSSATGTSDRADRPSRVG